MPILQLDRLFKINCCWLPLLILFVHLTKLFLSPRPADKHAPQKIANATTSRIVSYTYRDPISIITVCLLSNGLCNTSRLLTPPRAAANPTVGVLVPNRFKISSFLYAARYPRIFFLISSSLSVLRSTSNKRHSLKGFSRSGWTIRKSRNPSG